MLSITYKELNQCSPEHFQLIDIRSETAVSYGMIPDAIHAAPGDILQKAAMFPKDKLLVLYCANGMLSAEKAKILQDAGYHARSLDGGYAKWILSYIEGRNGKNMPSIGRIEKSIRKKFHKELFSKFAKAVKTYELVKEGDRIAVCISGGKDSMLMAKLFQELKWHRKMTFDLIFLVMDPGYSETNRRLIEKNAQYLGIPATIFESNIFDAVYTVEKSPCYLCARMRRGYLYSHAKQLGCNKIALGHHYDDVIETILMGMLYGGQVQTMMPKLHSSHFEGMELIRPMYLIREKDIRRWRDYNHLSFLQCACHFTDTCASCSPDGFSDSKRMEIKHLIAGLSEKNPFIESNIFRSVENINLRTVIAYKKDGVKHHFLDHYDEGTAESP